jgi:nucleotide-binding universal stress UspA family protein
MTSFRLEVVMKILLAVDDSKFSEASLEALLAQFPPQGTEVRVLHVVEPIAFSPPPQMAAGYAPELKDQIKEGQALVESMARKLRAAGYRVSTAVETGDAREKIVDSAEQWVADLIMLGSHGRRGVSRFLLGSVAESVARHAPCSVEIVRAAAGR